MVRPGGSFFSFFSFAGGCGKGEGTEGSEPGLEGLESQLGRMNGGDLRGGKAITNGIEVHKQRRLSPLSAQVRCTTWRTLPGRGGNPPAIARVQLRARRPNYCRCKNSLAPPPSRQVPRRCSSSGRVTPGGSGMNISLSGLLSNYKRKRIKGKTEGLGGGRRQ